MLFRSKTQQEAALFRELSFAKQRIQLRFSNNLETLNSISREINASEEDPKLKQLVREQADDLVLNNHEIVKIIWLNADNQKQWTVPSNISKSDWLSKAQNNREINDALNSTIELSKATSRAAFSQFISLDLPNEETLAKDRKTVFWQVVPNITSGQVNEIGRAHV